MIKHTEPRGPPQVKRGAPEKNQRVHGKVLLEAMSTLVGDAEDNAARLEKEAAEAVMARRAAAKQKYFDMKMLKEEDDDAVSAEELKAALQEWKAEISKPSSSAGAPAEQLAGVKRVRDNGAAAADDAAQVD
jgi:hypothetical protein